MRASRFSSPLIVVIALLAVPSFGATQGLRGLSIGIQGAYNFNDLQDAGAGLHAVIDLPAGLAVYPAVQSYFVTSARLWRFSTTLRWMPRSVSFRPYVAAGPYWSRTSGGGVAVTDLGFLGQVGAESRGRILRPFAEVQVLKDGAVSAELAAGVRVVVVHW
ncbi:MAG: hypothetical protein DMD45_15475 [Gemmatimonadetes bacterium]|nr:MAG: hypothetical protein DMD45_15475 [Gemmatimonadota bacterium]